MRKLHPYSHRTGIRLLVPTTRHIVQAFPALLRIGEKELPLEVEGPLRNFTVVQDLERKCVTLFSEKYHLHVLPSLQVVEAMPPRQEVREFLDFGMHKKALWEEMQRRLDFRELFPLWFRLGGDLCLPERPPEKGGVFALLEEVEETSPEKVIATFTKIFLAGFSDLFVPEAKDRFYQGITDEEVKDPFYLLPRGSAVIRRLFLEEKEKTLHFLPHMPPEFFAGSARFITRFGIVSFTWSKKELNTVQLERACSGELHLQFPPALRSFRLKREKKERGERFSTRQPLSLEEGGVYYFDRFEK